MSISAGTAGASRSDVARLVTLPSMDPGHPWYPRVLVGAVSLIVSVAYGVLLYGFSVLVTPQAAGSIFSATVLSTAFGGAVLTGGLAAAPVGRFADRHGVRGVMAAGSLLGGVGMLGFAAATRPWHVLATWWLLLGPASAMTFYEPAFVVLQQWFDRDARNRAIATLTFLAGLSGPIFIPVTGALVASIGWRAAAATLGVLFGIVGGAVAVLVVRPAPDQRARRDADRERRPAVRALLRSPRFVVFTLAACLGLGAFEAIMLHRVARFTEAGFALSTVAFWAAASGVVSIPGRYLLPALASRFRGTHLFAAVLAAMTLAVALAIRGTTQWELVGHFTLFGLVLGAAIPMRAVVMGDWYDGPGFGWVMGAQATVIAVARAGAPALTGAVRDVVSGYALPFAVLTVVLAAAGGLVLASHRAPERSRAAAWAVEKLPGGPVSRGGPRGARGSNP